MDTCYPHSHGPLFSPRGQPEAQHCSEGFSPLFLPTFIHNFQAGVGAFFPNSPF